MNRLLRSARNDNDMLPTAEVQRIVDQALAEDIGWGDATTNAVLTVKIAAKGRVLVKEEGVIAGLPVWERVFHTVDPLLSTRMEREEGARVRAGEVVATVEGSAASILLGERVALNFLQRLSGIATATARYVEAVRGLPVRITDTRKTTPGLRLLEKYAVRVGGGHSHRFNLSDGILIKDNHLAALRGLGLGVREAVQRARQRAPHPLRIEVEVTTVEETRAAVEGGADAVLLDNMALAEMHEAVRVVAGRALVEASGGVTLDTVRAIAETGVNVISVGALTHSPKALDISLDLTLVARQEVQQ